MRWSEVAQDRVIWPHFVTLQCTIGLNNYATTKHKPIHCSELTVQIMKDKLISTATE